MDILTKDSHPGVASIVDQRRDICHGEGASGNMVDIVNVVHDQDGGAGTSATSSLLLEGDIDIGPDSDLQFESHEAAYKFYQEYAKSMGFTTSIKNSRRSKKSKDFIDAKFACSRYGVTPESDVGSSRRCSVKKTDCKASMHVKRNKYGKWVIHEFIKEHNHELLPALAYYFRIHRNVKLIEKNNIDILHAVSERTKKMFVDMSRQSASFMNHGSLRDAHSSLLDKEKLAHVAKRHENFTGKFNECVFKSWTDEQFDLRWWKMVGRFDLQDDEWIRSLYEDRKKWAPLYLSDSFLAGMSPPHRTDSNRYEEEAIADFDTWHKQPALKSPSPWEKQMSTIYTHAIFKKFQVEVLGVVGCHPRKEGEDGTSITYRVDDCEKDETFFVAWDETKSQVSCLCRSFEYRGFLCRHAMLVLQICGISSIPSQYILRRWTKDAKTTQLMVEGIERLQTRAQRYVALCKQAIELSEEGSLTQESHNITLRTLVDTLKNCVSVNNMNRSAIEVGDTYRDHDIVEAYQGNISTRTSKKKNAVKKRKVASETEVMLTDAEDNLHQMENLTSDGISLNNYYGSQQNVPGVGLGQLNSIGPNHEGFFGAQQSVHGLGHLDFRSSSSFSYSLQDDHDLRSAQLRGDASRHT
uniref:Protein FAR1-RELATED SEQUENCE n=1 Tax=Chenopodium quinoa TaxID=63459 RepID=A0A803LYC5_CHEQI